jgi:hypothetical protein
MKIRHRLGMKQHLPSRPSLVRLPFMKTLPRHMALYRSVRVRPASDLALLYPSLLADEKRERNCVALQNSMSGGRRAGCYSDHVYRGRASGFPAQNRLDFRRIVRIGVRWFSSSMSSCCRARCGLALAIDIGVGAKPADDAPLRVPVRVRNGRNAPPAPFSGNTISHGCPVATEAFQRSLTPSSSLGWDRSAGRCKQN